MPRRSDISSILVVGSGPIVIGQACEFDYSGTQAVQALKEEGYRVILVNPNPATVMTSAHLADVVYLEPLTVAYLTEVIKNERPDAILTTMGGQTALNVTMELHREKILEQYEVQVIGARIASIELAEDRRRFKEVVNSLGLETAASVTVKSVEEAKTFKALVGLPLVLRPSYTLGGLGGGIVRTEEEFVRLLEEALRASPIGEVLVEESLLGWKEFELEVMRDHHDNAIVVCSIENIDPMGVHTGDSITVAPIQTLSDEQYQTMRLAAINILRAVGVDCGGSNVQFAVQGDTGRMVVVEMNPRVSRSSALASKATGFPIARCSAKLAVGYTLDEVRNEITGATASSFEPALDYCAVKVPRFELEKFPMPRQALGTKMHSVGESLALGRTFLEALNKAIRASERGLEALVPLETIVPYTADDVPLMLQSAHPLRLFAAYSTLISEGEAAIEKVSRITGYDRWFLSHMTRQAALEDELATRTLDRELLLNAKRMGLSDVHIGRLTKRSADEIERLCLIHHIVPSVHVVDTCAGEFEAVTPYCYLTYGEADEGESVGKEAVMIVASGPNRVGQGLEFDTCCTLAAMAYRRRGRKIVMVNSNPETVSTDFTISDRLYIEPLTEEHVLQIARREQVASVVLQLGGQTPLNMIGKLQKVLPIVGTSCESMQLADNRGAFALLLKELGLRQSENRTATAIEQVPSLAAEVGYPVLLRPSHVLGGRNMAIVYNEEELAEYVQEHVVVHEGAPLLVDHFLENASEYDLDAVSDGKSLYIGGILQHIEAAGIHSGDSAAVFPPYTTDAHMLDAMRQAALSIARRLKVEGFMNIQFAVQDGRLYVIEVNPRASRTIPFLSKTSGIDLVDVAVRIWEKEDLTAQRLVPYEGGIGEGKCVVGWAVKEAVFSFDRFTDIDPQLGPEMRSTGEVIGIGSTFGEAFAKSQIAAQNQLPVSGRVFISVSKRDRKAVVPIAKKLERMGFALAATRGTARDLFNEGIVCETVLKVDEGHPNLIDHLFHHRIDLVINTPSGRRSRACDDDLRTVAMRLHIPYTTTISAAHAAVEAIQYLRSFTVHVAPLGENETARNG